MSCRHAIIAAFCRSYAADMILCQIISPLIFSWLRLPIDFAIDYAACFRLRAIARQLRRFSMFFFSLVSR